MIAYEMKKTPIHIYIVQETKVSECFDRHWSVLLLVICIMRLWSLLFQLIINSDLWSKPMQP